MNSQIDLIRIDLSTAKGRLIVCNQLSEQIWMHQDQQHHPWCSLNHLLKESYATTPRRITKRNLLKNVTRILDYYGHYLVKRCWLLDSFLTGQASYKRALSGIVQNDEVFACILLFAGYASAEALNSPAGIYLYRLESDVKNGTITEASAKENQDYVLIEDLALKADGQQQLLTNIFFKMVSSYICVGNFNAPSLALSSDEKKEIWEKGMEALYPVLAPGLNSRGGVIQTMLTKHMADGHTVYSYSCGSKLRKEIKTCIGYIDFFQPILEKYNSILKYHSLQKAD